MGAISSDPTIAEFQLASNIITTPTTVSKGPTPPTGFAAGNANIIIPRQNSSDLPYFQGGLYIQSFSTGVTTQFENDQVHRGMTWFPIRRSEIFVNFSIAWPFKSSNNNGAFQTMQAFQDALRQHQQDSALTQGLNPSPITFTYYNNTGTGNNHSQVVNNNLPILGNNTTLLQQANNLTTGNVDTNGNAIQAFNPTQPLTPLVYRGWIDTVQKQYLKSKSIYLLSYRMNVINTNSQPSMMVPNTSTGVPENNKWSASVYGLNWIQANTSSGDGIDLSKITGTVN